MEAIRLYVLEGYTGGETWTEWLISEQQSFRVVTKDATVDQFDRDQHDCVIVDADHFGYLVEPAAQQMAKRHPGVPIFVLTSRDLKGKLLSYKEIEPVPKLSGFPHQEWIVHRFNQIFHRV